MTLLILNEGVPPTKSTMHTLLHTNTCTHSYSLQECGITCFPIWSPPFTIRPRFLFAFLIGISISVGLGIIFAWAPFILAFLICISISLGMIFARGPFVFTCGPPVIFVHITSSLVDQLSSRSSALSMCLSNPPFFRNFSLWLWIAASELGMAQIRNCYKKLKYFIPDNTPPQS